MIKTFKDRETEKIYHHVGVDTRLLMRSYLANAIGVDTPLRLSRFFDNSPQFWMGLQSHYDLDVAEDQLGKRLDREVRPLLWLDHLKWELFD